MDLDMKGGVPRVSMGILDLSFKTMWLDKLKKVCGSIIHLQNGDNSKSLLALFDNYMRKYNMC